MKKFFSLCLIIISVCLIGCGKTETTRVMDISSIHYTAQNGSLVLNYNVYPKYISLESESTFDKTVYNITEQDFKQICAWLNTNNSTIKYSDEDKTKVEKLRVDYTDNFKQYCYETIDNFDMFLLDFCDTSDVTNLTLDKRDTFDFIEFTLYEDSEFLDGFVLYAYENNYYCNDFIITETLYNELCDIICDTIVTYKPMQEGLSGGNLKIRSNQAYSNYFYNCYLEDAQKLFDKVQEKVENYEE